MHRIILFRCATAATWGFSIAGIWLLPLAAVIVIVQAAGAATVIEAFRAIGGGEKSLLYRMLAMSVNAALRNGHS